MTQTSELTFVVLPPLVGFLVMGSFPIITVAAAVGAIRAAWQRRRERAAVLGALAIIGFSATLWSSAAVFSRAV